MKIIVKDHNPLSIKSSDVSSKSLVLVYSTENEILGVAIHRSNYWHLYVPGEEGDNDYATTIGYFIDRYSSYTFKTTQK